MPPLMINGLLQETKLFLLDFTTDTLLCQIWANIAPYRSLSLQPTKHR